MAQSFAQALQSGARLFFDGAMGTQLAAQGKQPGPATNLESPETVLAVHRAYREAGAEVLITNTFSANRPSLTKAGAIDRLEPYIAAGCRLARQAAGKDGFVAGDVGPTGEFLEPVGDMTVEAMRAAFEETARLLLQGGVDLFIIETMTDARECAVAVEACRAVGAGLPVVASMSFDPVRDGFRTNAGVRVAEAARALTEAGADAIGANCGNTTPLQMAEVARLFRQASARPIIIQANAGLPELRGTEAVFSLSPEEFARGMAEAARAGAQLLGGCCGTTPAHIRAMARANGKNR